MEPFCKKTFSCIGTWNELTMGGCKTRRVVLDTMWLISQFQWSSCMDNCTWEWARGCHLGTGNTIIASDFSYWCDLGFFLNTVNSSGNKAAANLCPKNPRKLPYWVVKWSPSQKHHIQKWNATDCWTQLHRQFNKQILIFLVWTLWHNMQWPLLPFLIPELTVSLQELFTVVNLQSEVAELSAQLATAIIDSLAVVITDWWIKRSSTESTISNSNHWQWWSLIGESRDPLLSQ